jgi:hypothetical protein
MTYLEFCLALLFLLPALALVGIAAIIWMLLDAAREDKR